MCGISQADIEGHEHFAVRLLLAPDEGGRQLERIRGP